MFISTRRLLPMKVNYSHLAIVIIGTCLILCKQSMALQGIYGPPIAIDCRGVDPRTPRCIELWLDGIMKSDKTFYDNMSEYFQKRSQSQMRSEELKFALRVEVNRMMGALQQSFEEKTNILSSLIQDTRKELREKFAETNARSDRILDLAQVSLKEAKQERRNMTEIIQNSLSAIQEIKQDAKSQSAEIMNTIQESMGSCEAEILEVDNSTEGALNVSNDVFRAAESPQNDIKVMRSLIRNSLKTIESLKQETKALSTLIHNSTFAVEEIKQVSQAQSEKVVSVIERSFFRSEQSNGEIKVQTRKILEVVENALKTMSQPKKEMNEQKQFSYTSDMIKSANKLEFMFSLRPILCLENGEFVIDWNAFQETNWLRWWKEMVGGKNDYLRAILMLPHEGDGVLIDLKVWRKGGDLLIKAKYASENKMLLPISMGLQYHMKIIFNEPNGQTSTIMKLYQESVLTNSEVEMVKIPSAKWYSFNMVKPPILILQIIKIDKST